MSSAGPVRMASVLMVSPSVGSAAAANAAEMNAS
jgi:hypothetical protein